MSDEEGQHHYLGYILRFGGITLYHAGDTISYDGLANLLSENRVDAAMLPVNGRSKQPLARGIAGNMTLDEAVRLCLEARVPKMMPHHFGRFAFNTIDRSLFERAASEFSGRLEIIIPHIDCCIVVRPEGHPSHNPDDGVTQDESERQEERKPF